MTTAPTQRVSAQVAANLRGELARAGIRQADLAPALGVSVGTLSSRMTGRTSFSIDEIDAAARLLGIPASRIVSFSNEVAA